ncbi:hypothetical protein BKP35_18320 [Anaerobacillus arseniciselenatis]|uniref:Uncharacterized protein n=1 Tax=Anaerobacillus arseniciselenatis TaxID=85682 RepID=A0A1S2L5I6_9BACI|nr:hypothetical protein [Anaerobacillus arseniciselenatis]OIJ07641.1 hypothetical protein BKP35_18320 [Anaerobacillus arseniciselenatis]
MKVIRKNKYAYASFRLIVSLLIVVVIFYLFSIGFILQGNEIKPLQETDRFAIFIGILIGYFAASMPLILNPLYKED